MKGMKFTQIGLLICLALFFIPLAILFWPVVQTPKFWLTTAMVIGMVGSLIFGIANAQNSGTHEN